jgi:hypothetical protein
MNDTQVQKGRGCFFYGCTTLAVVLVVIVVGGFFAARSFVNKAIEKYTDTAPMALPKVEISAAEAAAVQDRVKVFKAALDAGTNTEALALSEKELNALIAQSPDFAELKDKVYVGIVSNRITGQISLPLDKFPIGRTTGRYLNGSAAFNVSMDGGVLLVTLESLEVKGAPLPAQFLQGLKQQNLAKDADQDIKRAELLRKLQSIEVRDGRIVVTSRAGR